MLALERRQKKLQVLNGQGGEAARASQSLEARASRNFAAALRRRPEFPYFILR